VEPVVLTVQLVQAEHLALTDRLVHLVAVEQVVHLVQVVHRVHGVRRVQVEPVASTGAVVQAVHPE
jgi:hypothetical protein